MSNYRFFLVLILAVLTASCSSKPKHVSAAEFQRLFQSRNAQTAHWYSYLGETNGAAYMLQKTMPVVGSKWKVTVLFTETNGLAPGFVEQMREASKLEPSGPANGSQPFRVETNRTSSAAGSRR